MSRLAAAVRNTVSQPAEYFALDPADGTLGQVDSFRKTILGLELIEERAAQAGHLADLLKSEDLQRGG